MSSFISGSSEFEGSSNCCLRDCRFLTIVSIFSKVSLIGCSVFSFFRSASLFYSVGFASAAPSDVSYERIDWIYLNSSCVRLSLRWMQRVKSETAKCVSIESLGIARLNTASFARNAKTGTDVRDSTCLGEAKHDLNERWTAERRRVFIFQQGR